MKKTTTSTNKSTTTAKTTSASTSSSGSTASLTDNSKIAVVDIQALVSQTPSVLALRQERQNQIVCFLPNVFGHCLVLHKIVADGRIF